MAKLLRERTRMDGPAEDAALEPVESEAISAIGYDAPSRTLFVRFRAGGLYAYLDTPPELFAAFRAAESKGAFFQARIDPVLRYLKLV